MARPNLRLVRSMAVPLVLAGFALALYLPGIAWGTSPFHTPNRTRAWGVDDESPLGTLSEITGIRRPAPNRNLGYPIGHPLVVGAASAPYLGVLAATGHFKPGTEDRTYGFTNPTRSVTTLAMIAHVVSTCFAVMVVLAAWFAAREFWGTTAGVVAGVMVATSFPMFYYSRTGNVDMAQLGWMAAAIAAATRFAVAGATVGRGIWIGAFAGAAVGTKEPIAAAFLGLPLFLLGLQWWDHRTGRYRTARPWLPALAAAVAGGLAFGIFSGLFVDPERYLAHVAFMRGRVSDAAGGNVAFVNNYPWTLKGHVELASLLTGLLANTLTWPGLVLAVAGTGLAVMRRLRSAWLIVLAGTYLAVLFFSARFAMLRYVMPAAWILGLLAAFACTAAMQARAGFWRVAGTALAAAMILINLGRGVDLTYAMWNDSRYFVTEWFVANAPAGSRVAYFGSEQKLPEFTPGTLTQRAGEYRGAAVPVRIDEVAAQRIVEQWGATPPEFVIIMPDHSSKAGMPYPASCPPSLFAGLEDGRLGYRLVAHFQSPSLLPWLKSPPLDYPTVNPPIRLYRRVPG